MKSFQDYLTELKKILKRGVTVKRSRPGEHLCYDVMLGNRVLFPTSSALYRAEKGAAQDAVDAILDMIEEIEKGSAA